MALTVAELSPELLAQLRAAQPEQLGDDLVLRLPDGRVYFVDGFFALDGIGDGAPPMPEAIALGPDVADALLGSVDIQTAAGDEPVPPAENTGTSFTEFTPTEKSGVDEETGLAPSNSLAGTDANNRSISAIERRFGIVDRDGESDVATGPAGSPFDAFGGGYLGSSNLGGGAAMPPIGAVSIAGGMTAAPVEGYPGITAIIREFLNTDLFALTPFTHMATLQDAAFRPNDFNGERIWFPASDMLGFFTPADFSNVTDSDALKALFNGDDIIHGTNYARDSLYGNDGNDVILGQSGENYLYGGNGNDLLYVVQQNEWAGDLPSDGSVPWPAPFERAEGGDGFDTLVFAPTFPWRQIDLREMWSSMDGIEAVAITAGRFSQFHDNGENGGPAGERGIFVVDAATVAQLGGTLRIESDGDVVVRLTDLETTDWQIVSGAEVPAGYVRYAAVAPGGESIALDIGMGAQQPIVSTIVGTAEADHFWLSGLKFRQLDGGGGYDVISGSPLSSVMNLPLQGTDFTAAAAPIIRNIESIILRNETIALSADVVNAMTDANNLLTIRTEHQPTITLADIGNWDLIGLVARMETYSFDIGPATAPSFGAMYSSISQGEQVLLHVVTHVDHSSLPQVDGNLGLDRLFITFGGMIDLPGYDRTSILRDLDVVELTGDTPAELHLTADFVAVIAGSDKTLAVTGHDGSDAVILDDSDDWRLVGVTRGGGEDAYVYQAGEITLEVSTGLKEPVLNPLSTAGNDVLTVSDILPDSIDGSTGFDILQVLSAGTVDLHGSDTIRNIEAIDIGNGAANDLVLDAATVAALTSGGKLYVTGDHDGSTLDRVSLLDHAAWQQAGTEQGGGFTFVLYMTQVTVNSVTAEVTLAIDSTLQQPIF
jgi:hypothetical protein